MIEDTTGKMYIIIVWTRVRLLFCSLFICLAELLMATEKQMVFDLYICRYMNVCMVEIYAFHSSTTSMNDRCIKSAEAIIPQ